MSQLDNILLELIDKYRDEDTILDRYEQNYSTSPEELIIERESRQEAINLLNFCMKYLPDLDKELVYLYVIENKTLQQIGKIKNRHKTSIMRKLRKIPDKVKKLYDKYATNNGVTNLNKKETFEEMRDMLFYISPKFYSEHTCMGLPHEIMRKQFKWGNFYRYKKGKKAGTVVWKAAYECRISDYLAQSFGVEKGEVVCPLCPKCTRSESHIKVSKL